MALVSNLLATLNGLPTNVNLATSDLVTNSVWVGGTSTSPSVQITPTLLNSYLVNPMTTAGDIIYENGTPAPARLPIGSSGQVLTVSGGLPAWVTPTTSGGTVTTVSVVSANGLAGTVANATTTPAITLSTTVTAPVLAGNGTAITAATTTGTGNTVVLATGPALTAVTTDTLTASGNITSTAGTVSGTNLTTGGHASADLALAGGTMSGAINMGANQINNLAMAGSPASTDATNVNYVQSQISAAINGLTWKGPVSAFASSNTALTGGATLTIDGYAVQNGNYVILANQTTSSQQGVYQASGIGTAYVLTAVTTGSEAPTAVGDAYLVLKGTTYANSAYQVNGLSPITFIQFAGPNTYNFTSPLALSGNTVSVGYDNTTIGDNGSNQLYVPTGGIGTTQLASASVTTAKLGTVTDGVTLDQSGAGSTLEIKAGGVGTTQLASLAVTVAKLGTITDGVTLDQAGIGATLEIKTGGVGTTQLASQAVTSAKIATSAVDGTTLTGGNGSALSVQYAPALKQTFTSAVALTANTSYLVRMTLNSDAGTAGQLYLADSGSAASAGKFWAIGICGGGASGVSIGGTVTVTLFGTYTLGSSDTAFTTAQLGMPVWLTTAGGFSTTPPSAAGSAAYKVGIVQTTTSILLDSKQLTVVN